MAQQRIKTAELVRLFNAIDRPVYVLDDELVIRFCNEAFAEWIGPVAGELVGCRCAYHTRAAGADMANVVTVAEGLCPPPTVLEGRATLATITATGADGAPRRRRARFVPVGLSGCEPMAIVALVEPVDLDAASATAADDEAREDLEPAEPRSDQLHERIARFRHEAAGRYGTDRLLGTSAAMRLARARVELAAAGRANVLVVGPVGSGREHVAHAVHYAGDPAREGTTIPVDCAVLDADLIRSTVQALAAGPLGERAARSTLLLGEADLLPCEVQPAVAAAITARSFRMRVVATATEPLESLAAAGRYDPHLAAIMSTIVIQLPALADRREDIPLLAQTLLEEANPQAPRQLAGFTPEALDRLDAYGWPGNVDELAAVVAEARARAGGRQIEPRDLPDRLRHAAEAEAHRPRDEETIRLDEFLGRIERELIARALAKAKGNKTKAAALVGMTRPRLYRRMVQLGLEDE